jgi:hypothetical protein
VAAKKKVTSEFTKTSRSFNFFGLVSSKTNKRRDKIKVFNEASPGFFEETELFVNTDRESQHKWAFLTNGELHKKEIHLLANINDKTKLMKDPIVELEFFHRDNNATTDELEKHYLPFIDRVAGVNNFLNFTPRIHAAYQTWGIIDIRTRVLYSEFAVNKLLELPEAVLIEAFAKAAHQSTNVYRQISNSAGMGFIKSMRFARRSKKADSQMKYFTNALDRMVRGGFNSFDPKLIGVVHDLIGREHLYISSSITVPVEETKLPGGVEAYNSRGKKPKDFDRKKYILFDMDDALSVYTAF